MYLDRITNEVLNKAKSAKLLNANFEWQVPFSVFQSPTLQRSNALVTGRRNALEKSCKKDVEKSIAKEHI